jgi:hypothetical protein
MKKLLITCLIVLGCFVPPSFSQLLMNFGGDFENDGFEWRFNRGWDLDCEAGAALGGLCAAGYLTDESLWPSVSKNRFLLNDPSTCDFGAWLKTALEEDPFWPDGEPTRTGLTVQLWDYTGFFPVKVAQLGLQDPEVAGYFGQGGVQDWTFYVHEDIEMEAGRWETRIFMHGVRQTNDDGWLIKVRNPIGEGWVDDITLDCTPTP